MNSRQILRGLLAVGLAAVAGAAAQWAALPLAWLLGPLTASMIVSLAGIGVGMPKPLLRVGQVALGASIGLSVSASALSSLVDWVPLIVATAFVSIFAAALFSTVLSRLTGINAQTAFFASLPGGLVEMSGIGAQMGASPEPIAVVQAIRVALIVMIVPTALVALGITTGMPTVAPAKIALQMLPFVFVAAVAGALLALAVRLNNPWILGPLIAIATLSATSFFIGRMPTLLFSGAQFIVGFSLGARFQRAIIRKLPMVALVGAGTVLGLTGMLAAYAIFLSRVVDLDPATAILATSIGGASEMAVTAQILHLDVSLIIAFHLTRAFLVNGFATYYWSLFSRLGLFRGMERLLGARKPDAE